uniref:Uncharacterized protein n=1 Tax=Mus musculus TaxID=10090 RepID=Q8CEJ5_MOUSE|nr:unnamed protein product [Mus musculus]
MINELSVIFTSFLLWQLNAIAHFFRWNSGVKERRNEKKLNDSFNRKKNFKQRLHTDFYLCLYKVHTYYFLYHVIFLHFFLSHQYMQSFGIDRVIWIHRDKDGAETREQ